MLPVGNGRPVKRSVSVKAMGVRYPLAAPVVGNGFHLLAYGANHPSKGILPSYHLYILGEEILTPNLRHQLAGQWLDTGESEANYGCEP